jgi:sterol desaturase/sphingolipid hydroxylase (fatty acid hydroxylase superfamily)
MENERPLAWPDRMLAGFERMAVTEGNLRAAFVADVGMCLGLVALALGRGDMHPLGAVAAFGSGLLLFSLIEYCFHRWLFHGPDQAMERGHRQHHVDPLGIGTLPFFLPPVFLLVIVALLSKAMPLSYALLLTGAIAGGYFAYGQCHALIHRRRFRHPLARRWAASHHIHHHHHDRNFGVTSPLWDLLLGTRHAAR